MRFFRFRIFGLPSGGAAVNQQPCRSKRRNRFSAAIRSEPEGGTGAKDRTARAYQVGDSVTLVIGQRGAIKWKSTSHSPVGYAIESGMLDEADAIHHDQLHVVSNLVGCRSMHIDVGPSQPLAPRDTVIVASDGLSDNLQLDEIVRLGRSGKLLGRIEKLAQLTADRMSLAEPGCPGKPDDLTLLMYTPG